MQSLAAAGNDRLEPLGILNQKVGKSYLQTSCSKGDVRQPGFISINLQVKVLVVYHSFYKALANESCCEIQIRGLPFAPNVAVHLYLVLNLSKV